MAKNFKDYVTALPVDEQKEIEEGTKRLIAEEMTLSELRKAMKRTQKVLSEKMNVNQPAISKIESRTDIYVSTLREFVEAMGGELDITVRFPDRPPVKIKHFHEVTA